MNPFELKCKPVGSYFMDWNEIYPQPLDKRGTDPYTKTRIILMNGTEFEGVQASHQVYRRCGDNELRGQMALCRRLTQQRQKKLSMLKSPDETILEHTISYEQLAVDLTARMAQDEADGNVKAALDFALLEDFDHLYRYADLMEMEGSMHAESLVGKYTEITPGRPTIAEHRHPFEAVNKPITKDAAPLTKLHVNIITAAEQQTMNYYMNAGGFYQSELGRKLYQEIAMIEEQHVSEYGSLKEPGQTALQCMLMHDYTACYLYYSCMEDETDATVRHIWEQGFEQTAAQLQQAAKLMQEYEGKHWQELIPDGKFPKLLSLGPNIDYVRGVLGTTVHNTKRREGYVDVRSLPDEAEFFVYQKTVNPDANMVPSHAVIQEIIKKNGQDYRWETGENPVQELRNRKLDNVTVGRK